MMTVSEQGRLKLTDDQKKDAVALQKAVEDRFSKVLTEVQKKQLKLVFAQRGPGRGGPGPSDLPQPGKIFSGSQQETLKLSESQKKRLDEIQKDIDAKLATLLTEDQKRQLQTMQQRGPGGGPGRTMVPPGGRPLFRATRYATSFPGFAGKTLTPGKTLEEMVPKEPEKKVGEKKG